MGSDIVFDSAFAPTMTINEDDGKADLDTPEGWAWVEVAGAASAPFHFKSFNPSVVSQNGATYFTDGMCLQSDSCHYYTWKDGVSTEYTGPAALPTEGGGTLIIVGKYFGAAPTAFVGAATTKECEELFGGLARWT